MLTECVGELAEVMSRSRGQVTGVICYFAEEIE